MATPHKHQQREKGKEKSQQKQAPTKMATPNQATRECLAARRRFANAKSIWSCAESLDKPRNRTLRKRNSHLTTAKTCSTLQRTDDFACSIA